MGQGLRLIKHAPVLEVVIDRPKANAINAVTSRLMGEAFQAFRDDPAYRVAILTGAGDRFFSAGWDLSAASPRENPTKPTGAWADSVGLPSWRV